MGDPKDVNTDPLCDAKTEIRATAGSTIPRGEPAGAGTLLSGSETSGTRTRPRDAELQTSPTLASDSPQETAQTLVVERQQSLELGSSLELPATMSGHERYERRSVLGMGGMGEVILCEDRLIGRSVALKRMHAEMHAMAGAEQRFLREARVQARIEHPSVVPVYDLGASGDGGSYFTMRRIRGRTLEQILEGLAARDEATMRRYSRRKLLTAFVSVCLAVHYAHTRGVVHRDLKPGNIMFGDFGEVYVLDWGIAKVLDPAERQHEAAPAAVVEPSISWSWADTTGEKLTEVGQLVGTLGYMAPEQMRGKPVDRRADIYSLGVILFELLTLRRLHESSVAQEIYQAVLSGGAAAADAGDIPPELDSIWRRACALDAGDRFDQAQDLADAIERFLDGDRDVEQRRKLASQHVERAQAVAQSAFAQGVPAAEAAAARVEATSEVMKALALEPGDKAARHMLARLLVEAPDELPADAQEALRRSTEEARLHGIRAGLLGFVSWLVCVPFAALLGVHHWGLFGAIVAALVIGTGFNLWLVRRGITSTWAALLLASVALAVVVMVSFWLGPFVVVPTAAAVTTLLFATQASRRERFWFVGLGALGAGLPYVLDLTGVVPPGFAFEHGNLVIFQRAFALPPAATLAALIYASVSFCVVPAVYVGRLRDSLSRAERKLFLHAWQLSRLASE